ncbi:MAG TPA: class I SAM-dependent rRNA methyltransferase [Candidatus Polarisedimenticolia bacterium]|jgi:23S rRNA (cytosine1962-C5)-methyltransferase|nr:class I SAM-dependent rRNA methyltransferase [Candidatus Polarisedimenticolia bacterium]
MASVVLGKGKDRRLKGGHLWVYASEIASVDEGAAPGEVVDVRDHRRRFLGRGTYNPASTITVRLLTREPEEGIDRAFFERRIDEALAYRERVFPGETALRLIYGEADLLPGLVVDRYGAYLCVQIGTLGMDRHRALLLTVLRDRLNPAGIYERGDLSSRAHEGLPPAGGPVAGEVPAAIPVRLDGLEFHVRLAEAQKTGLYLDQRLNRRALLPLAAGRTVLDAFCNTGGFGLYALRGGARSLLGVDISALCVARAAEHAALNGFGERCEFEEANAFDRLHALDREGRRFGIVVLDPPAFTKSARNLEAACRGYKEINLRALKILEAGGCLLTSSCSYHLSLADFLSLIREAVADSGRTARLVSVAGQSPDHPVLPGVPETSYLKFAVLHVS